MEHGIRATVVLMNLTVTIDDDVLRRARIKALQEGTSVNAIVRRQLEAYVSSRGPADAVSAILEQARRSTASSGAQGRRWTRDSLYER